MTEWSEDFEHDCTAVEFEEWCDQLADLLMDCEPSVCDGTSVTTSERTLQLDLYGQQVKRLVDELTLLAQYKASTEAARRRSQDRRFLGEMRARMDGRDRELYKKIFGASEADQ